MKTNQMLRSATVFAGMILLAATTHAAITVQGYWRLGEDDPGAADGVLLSTQSVTVDSTGTLDLTMTANNPFYTPNIYSSTAAPGSTLAAEFNTVPYYTAVGAVSTATDNIGYEIWFRPKSPANGDRLIFGISGYDIYVSGGKFGAHISGAYLGPVDGSPDVADYYDQWVHLALVRDSGTSLLYIDGVPHSFTNNIYAGPTPTQLFISQPNTTTFNLLDEARIFTFAAGEFDPNDLLFFQTGVPEPSTVMLFGVAGFVLLRRRSS